MRTSILYNDGLFQLNLSPDTEFEKEALEKIEQRSSDVEVIKGEFGMCQGGYARKYGAMSSVDLMLVIKEKKEDK